MEPERFAFVTSDQPGLSHRSLGSFTEREITISFRKVASGCTIDLPPSAQTQLIFVREGRGAVHSHMESDHRDYVENSAIRVSAAERLTISALDETLLFFISLPI